MSLLRAMVTVGGLTMVSRVAGFARDVLTAAVLGASPMADAFFVALKLPNLSRRLFADGAFTVAFVPLVTTELARHGRPAALAFAGEALAALLAVLVPLTLVALLAMPGVLHLIAPGFVDDPERYPLALDYTRIAFPYLMLMSVAALLGGALNAVDRFAPFAAAPILFNLVLIAALLLGTDLAGSPGRALAIGVTVAGVVQVLWLALWCRRAGLAIRLPRPRLTIRVRRLLALVGPGAVGAGVTQINMFLNLVLASFLSTGAVSYLYYADRLNQLPLGVVGIALGTALLPTLSRQVAIGRGEGVVATQSRALEYGLVLALPAGAALAILAHPIIAALFERGAFGPAETEAVAAALAAYAVGIPAYILVKVLSTLCFARQDTRTPVRMAVIATVAGTAASVVLLFPLGHVGIALATALSSWLNAAILARALSRGGLLGIDLRLRRRVPRQIAATAGMVAVLSVGVVALEPALAAGGAARAGALALVIFAGAVAYGALCVVLGAVGRAEIARIFRIDRAAAARR